MAKLIIRDGKGGEREHELVDDITTIGRSSANIIQIKDEQSSRQHCRIEKAGDGYRLVDLGSRNGTTLNGAKVSGQTLKPGDTVTIGEHSIAFDAPMQVSADELGATVEVSPLQQEVAAASAGAAVPAAPAKTEESAPQFILEVVEGSGAGTRVELGVEPITIGRNNSNKLVINDEAASNYHAEVAKEAIGYVISDLGSTNSTKVNDEKIVKSPLAHGARIRIGSTVIVFKNLGAPTEEDAVFGTVVLDSDKLDRELAAARAGGGGLGRFLAVLVLLGVVAGGAYGIAQLLKSSNGENGTTFFSKVPNPEFNQGTKDNGEPKEWRIYTDDTRNRAIIDKEGMEPGTPENPKYALKFQRDEATAANARIECAVAGSFEVDKACAYRASTHLKCPGAMGLYGLRLTWKGPGGREHENYKTISGAHPDWKKVEIKVRPPRWAGKLRLALVAFGNSGNVWFDNVELKKIPAAEAPAGEETIDFSGVTASFGPAGRLSLERGGLPALGGLIVAEGQGGVGTGQELARAAAGFPRQQGEETFFQGSIYDFSRHRTFNYNLAASKGSGGVRLRYSFWTQGQELTLDKLSLRFLIEPAFATAPVVYASGGRKSFTEGAQSGVRELVLRSGEKVLALSFAQPADIEMKSYGEKKQLTVTLAKSPSLGVAPKSYTLGFAPASASERAILGSEFDKVRHLFGAKNWKDFPGAARGFRSRFPGAKDELAELDRMEKQYRDALKQARAEADLAVRRAEAAMETSLEAYQKAHGIAKAALARLKKEWAPGSALAQHLDDCEVKLANTEAKLKQAELEAEAEKRFEKIKGPREAKVWVVVKALCDQLIKDYPGTKAAGKAKQLREVAVSNMARKKMIYEAEDRILKNNTFRNLKINDRTKEARDFILNHQDWRKYGKEMKGVQRELEELNAKLRNP